MQPQVRLREEVRMRRRTVADAFEIVREERRGEQVAAGAGDGHPRPAYLVPCALAEWLC